MAKGLAILLLLTILVAPGYYMIVQPLQGPDASPQFSVSSIAGSEVNYTIYAGNVNAGLLISLNSFTSRWNSAPAVFGNLIEISVPTGESSYAAYYLSSLKSSYGISFFRDNSSFTFSPQSSFAGTAAETPNPSDYLPSTMYKAYNYSYASSSNIFGNGTTIVIIDAYGDPYLRYDISAFDNISGLPPVSLKVDYLNKTPLQFNRSWALETAMDVEWAHASAPGAKIILVISQNAGSGLEDAVSYAVSGDLGNVISLSWGASETSLINQVGLAGISTLSSVYEQAYREGISVFAASGDSGAYDSTGALTVNFPASDPFVTGVGGTSLFKYQNKYEEDGWGGKTSSGTFGSGGGYSSVFSAPSWQAAPGFSGSLRGVPDVSAVADKYTGVLVVYGGNAYQAGGTSLSTPIWGGVIARLDQYAGHPLGFVNPLLYQIARTSLYNSSFNTIIKGTNGYYNVTKGWNPVTGLGSPNVSGLLKAYSRITSPFGFTVSPQDAYNSTAIYATITYNSSSTAMLNNGTSFYFDSLAHNSSNYVRFGIAANSSGLFALINVANGTEKYSRSSLLGPYPFTGSSINISMQWSGYELTAQAGSYSRTFNLFIPFIGEAVPGVGAEIIGSLSNDSPILGAKFSNIRILESGHWTQFGSYYESHFSGIAADPAYSSLSGLVQNGTVTVVQGGSQHNGLQSGNASSVPQITYLLSYRNPVSLKFGLSGNLSSSVSSWKFNGTVLSGNSATVSKSGVYNITAVTAKGDYSRSVYVQNTTTSSIKLTNPVSAYQSTVTVTVNHFSAIKASFIDQVTLKYTAITGENSLTIRSSGYTTYSASVLPKSTLSYTMTPVSPVLTLYISPGIANVTAGPTVIHGFRGVYRSEVNAGPITLKVGSKGYVNYTGQLFMKPGKNVTMNIHLVPANPAGLKKLNGFVRDAPFYFDLEGVKVMADNSSVTYTNSTGNFTLYLPSGNHTIFFSLPLYNNTSEQVNITGNSSITVNMYPAGLSSVPFYSIYIHYAFPMLFFFMYLSWSSQSAVSNYAVYYSTSPGFGTYREVNVSGTQNYAILNIYPVRTYYVQIFGYSPLGKIVSSNEIVVSGTSPVNVLVNTLMVAGIVIYAAVAVRFARKAFYRKKL